MLSPGFICAKAGRTPIYAACYDEICSELLSNQPIHNAVLFPSLQSNLGRSRLELVMHGFLQCNAHASSVATSSPTPGSLLGHLLKEIPSRKLGFHKRLEVIFLAEVRLVHPETQ